MTENSTKNERFFLNTWEICETNLKLFPRKSKSTRPVSFRFEVYYLLFGTFSDRPN